MPTVKRAYLARRNPGLPAEHFAARWRQHMELGLKFPELPQRYRQIRYCRVLHAADGVGGHNPGYDGVGFLVLRDPAQLSAPYQDAAIGPTMRADELRVFSAHVADAALAAEEIVLRPGGGPIGVLQFLKRRAGTTAEAFRKDWRERHASLVLAQTPGLQGYVQNDVLADATIDCDGLSEMWFSNLEQALAALRDPAIAADRECFTEPAATLTLTTEVCCEAEF